MGTEVLYQQDLLAQRLHVVPPPFHRRRNYPANGDLTNLIVNRRPSHHITNNNNNSNKKTSPKSDKRKSNETKRATHGGDARRKDGGGPAMGHVMILRRGQSLNCIAAKLNDGGDARAPSPPLKKPAADDMAIKQIRSPPPPLADVYAGSAFSLSPSPRSLPLPSFFNKKQQDCATINPSDNPATRDLRRLLRLD